MKIFKEEGLNIGKLPLMESLMSLGNGYIGVRAYLEEFDYLGSVRGNYINGIYERVPMCHAEWAHGFPLESDRMPNLIDLFNITIFLDEEEVVVTGNIEDFVRELDFENGLALRSYKYTAKNGKEAYIHFEQLLSFPYPQLRSWTLEITYNGKIKVINNINFDVFNMVSEDDPRIASTQIPLIKVIDYRYESGCGGISMETINSGIRIELEFRDEGRYHSDVDANHSRLNIYYEADGSFLLSRLVKYQDSIRNNIGEFINKEKLYKEQKEYLDRFNKRSSVDFLDDNELDNAMDFMEFHLLQSTTQDVYGNISAKGLSGEGYEGHYFWDTEIFLFPVWLLWDKERAEKLLLYRYNLLSFARERAREMGHRKGVCFAWRTISGIESSGYFPAGSAQYHINFDIAYTFIQWWHYTKDVDFLKNYTIELLLETSRTALEIGSFQEDGFHIHGVTGPDEYTAMISDNYYTNKMAQHNLKWFVSLWEMLKIQCPKDYGILKDKLSITDEEIELMKAASGKMFFIYDYKKGIVAQDSTFLTKPKWPKELDKRPLLLHYHPLTIYRYQILKQADTVLALYLLPKENKDIIRETFYYYEEINTHDSSLSQCISTLMACKLRDEGLAYQYFKQTVYMDILDLKGNTSDGLHMANIGGTLVSVLNGFGGIRVEEDGLHINPFVPKWLGRIRFRFTWKDTLLEVLVYGENADIKKIEGPSLEVFVKGERKIIGDKAVLFDLDGVLTGTSDNHFEGWKKMCLDIGLYLPEEFRDKVRGISRAEALDMILGHFGLDYSEEEKLNLTNRKNNYYKGSIASFSSDNLYPGVKKLLENLKYRNVKMGLVSASKNAPQLIKAMNIEHYFDVIVNPDKVARGKPYPDLFLEAARKMDVNPSRCLGVEDARAGIESIKRAGMTAVGIGEGTFDNADIAFNTIADAHEYILDWLED